MRYRFSVYVKTAQILLLSSGLYGQTIQTKAGGTASDYYSPHLFPSELQTKVKVLGDRMQKPGKERVTLQGTLSSNGSPVAAQVVLERGGKVSLTATGKQVVFNGQATVAGPPVSDSSYLASFADDLVETLMDTVAQGRLGRLVGQRFPDGTGGLCDVYEIVIDSKTKAADTRVKRYCFGSSDGFLRSVKYPITAAPNSPMAETRFSDWRVQGGQAFPGRVTRLEGGQTIFDFQANPAAPTISPKATDNLFSVQAGDVK